MSVQRKLASVARAKTSWSGGYTAPTSSAFGGTLGAPTPAPSAPSAPPAAPATIPPPPAPTDAATGHVDPFFRPEDLLAQDNFWAQWNTTFAGLDQQLGDLQRNTAFERAQLADSHKANVSGINDNAAARGIGQSSIRDGNQAQEQTNFTRSDQNLQDALNSFSTYVHGQKDNFNTNVLPGFNSAEDAQAVQNAQDVPYTPPAPTQPAAQATPPRVVSQQQQPTPRQVIHHATRMIHHALGVIQATSKIQGGSLQ